jgi:hypothetical protein
MFQDIIDLYKAKSHKYTHKKRVYIKGKPAWRYFYKEHHGKGATHVDDLKEGEAFKVNYEGNEGHFHIKKIKDGKITVIHDETKEKKTLTKRELRAVLLSTHAEALKANVKKKEERFKNAKSEKAKENAKRRLRQAKRKTLNMSDEEYQAKIKEIKEMTRNLEEREKLSQKRSNIEEFLEDVSMRYKENKQSFLEDLTSSIIKVNKEGEAHAIRRKKLTLENAGAENFKRFSRDGRANQHSRHTKKGDWDNFVFRTDMRDLSKKIDSALALHRTDILSEKSMKELIKQRKTPSEILDEIVKTQIKSSEQMRGLEKEPKQEPKQEDNFDTMPETEKKQEEEKARLKQEKKEEKEQAEEKARIERKIKAQKEELKEVRKKLEDGKRKKEHVKELERKLEEAKKRSQSLRQKIKQKQTPTTSEPKQEPKQEPKSLEGRKSMNLKDFNSLKKGTRVLIKYNNHIQGINTFEFEVGKKSYNKAHDVTTKRLYFVENNKPKLYGIPITISHTGHSPKNKGRSNYILINYDRVIKNHIINYEIIHTEQPKQEDNFDTMPKTEPKKKLENQEKNPYLKKHKVIIRDKRGNLHKVDGDRFIEKHEKGGNWNLSLNVELPPDPTHPIPIYRDTPRNLSLLEDHTIPSKRKADHDWIKKQKPLYIKENKDGTFDIVTKDTI